MRLCASLLASLTLVSGLAAEAFPQAANARLDGVLTDPSGAIVPGVTVSATNEGTNLGAETVSNESGLYVFANLPPGIYTLAAGLAGFKRYARPGIQLRVGDTVTINIRLETGQINEQVTVTAASPDRKSTV